MEPNIRTCALLRSLRARFPNTKHVEVSYTPLLLIALLWYTPYQLVSVHCPYTPFPPTKTKKFAPNTIGNFILFHTMLLYSNTANFVINKAFHQIRTQTRLESEEREQSVPLADMQVNI